MTNKLSSSFGVLLILTTFLTINAIAQNPAKYICNKFDGKLSELNEERSFVGDTYKCEVKEQWDMMIQSELNDLILNDEYFGSSKKWKQTYVDSENYNRRSFSFDSDDYYIVNLYIPFEKKTDHFFISQ
jgi:hypothetical protein